MEALALAVAVGIGLLVGWAKDIAKRKRRQAVEAVAGEMGLAYDIGDSHNTIRLSFRLFAKGDGRGIENTIWGTADGIPVRIFDYWYYVQHRDQYGRRHRTYHRFTCAVTPVPARCPWLSISREGMLSRAKDVVGMRDIEFESAEFNSIFEVRSADRRFAYALIDARMMEWLLQRADGWAFEVNGRFLLAYAGPIPPERWPRALTLVREFVERFPRAVTSMYPAAPDMPGLPPR